MPWKIPFVSTPYQGFSVNYPEPLTGKLKWEINALSCPVAQSISLGANDTIAVSSKNELAVFESSGTMLWKIDLAQKGAVCVADPKSLYLVHTQNNSRTLSIRNIEDGTLLTSLDVQINPHIAPVFSAEQNMIIVNILLEDKSSLAIYDTNLNISGSISLDPSSKKFQVFILENNILLIEEFGAKLLKRDGSIDKEVRFQETCTGAKLIDVRDFLLQFNEENSSKSFCFFDTKKWTFSDKIVSADLDLDSSVISAGNEASFTILCKSSKICNKLGLYEHRLVRFNSKLKPIWEYKSESSPRALTLDLYGNCFVAFSPECHDKYYPYQSYTTDSLSFLKGFNELGTEFIHYDAPGPLFNTIHMGRDGSLYSICERNLISLH